MIKIRYFFILAVCLLSSCQNEPAYQGYTESNSGVFYKLHSFGSSQRQVQPGNYITADIVYQTMNDSIFFTGRRTVKVTKPAYQGSIDDCFLMLSKGEEATFILPADPFFKHTLETALPGFINQQDSIKVTVDLIDVQTGEEFIKEKEAFLNWIEDFGDYEKVMLQQFLEQQQIDQQQTDSGLYHITLQEGEGPAVEEGDTVLVHYEGKFLNGKFFDSTKQRKQPFEFVYGHEMQVIKGMEKVIGKMREGEKALAILTSDVAFGKTGSSTGIIPPYTSVIYEVTLLDVRKSKGNTV